MRCRPGSPRCPRWGTLFRQSVQPHLVSWLRHDPALALAELEIPGLVVQGTTDLQVPVADGDRLASATEHATLARIEGMNHVLEIAPADPDANLVANADPALPLAPALIEATCARHTKALRRRRGAQPRGCTSHATSDEPDTSWMPVNVSRT